MVLSEEERERFNEVVQPVMEYMEELSRLHHPHITLIISSNHAELVEGVARAVPQVR